MRNPNGYGTVYKLSGKRRKPWIARVTTGWEPVFNKKKGTEELRQTYQTIGYFEDKKQALDALALHRLNPVSPKLNITLGEIYEEWSVNKYELISKATADNYRAAWNYVSKYKNIKFKELRSSHIQTIINACHKDQKSESTLKNIKILTNMLYNYAVENDITNKNYAQFLKIPKIEKEEKQIFSDIEIKILEENADKVEWVDTVLILIYTGMRISELLGLTKFNIDLKNDMITGGVKTDAGKNRPIPIHPKIKKYVENWYSKNGQTLICKSDGSKFRTKYFREEIYYKIFDEKLIDEKGRPLVRKLTPHCCRHTFASLMAKAGVDTLYIQRIIGHSDYATTANIYTHTDIDELKKAIGKI